MSFLRRGKKKDERFLSDTKKKLEDVGVIVVHDEQVNKRIEAIQDLHKTMTKALETTEPLKQVEELRGKLHALDLALRESGVPWTEQKDALRAWEKLLSYAKEGINIMKGSIEKKESDFDTAEIVDMLKSFLEVEIFPYGLMIVDHSYRDKHVSPSFNVVVPMQTLPGFGFGGGVAPSSGGRVSEETSTLPPPGPFPPQMDNRVAPKRKEEEE